MRSQGNKTARSFLSLYVSHSSNESSRLRVVYIFHYVLVFVGNICAGQDGLFDKGCQLPMINRSLLINRESGRPVSSRAIVTASSILLRLSCVLAKALSAVDTLCSRC